MERLKEAIEKARAQRDGNSLFNQAPAAPAPQSDLGSADTAPQAPGAPAGRLSWMSLEPLTLMSSRLRSRRVVTREQKDVATVPFDVLRARILKAFRDNGWKRLAITSPTKNCGKTFVSVNLAFSIARQPEIRTMLIDMDLRRPAVSATLGQKGQYRIRSWLEGEVPLERHMRRIDHNFALALNAESVRDAGELLLSSKTTKVLDNANDVLDPDIVIYDLPPALVNDDVFNFLPNVDAVLMVTAAGLTTPDQIESCEQLFENNCPFLGVVLNKVEDNAEENYGYGYGR